MPSRTIRKSLPLVAATLQAADQCWPPWLTAREIAALAGLPTERVTKALRHLAEIGAACHDVVDRDGLLAEAWRPTRKAITPSVRSNAPDLLAAE